MRNYFELADTSSDRKIDESEVTAFLDSINIRMKKDQLKKLMKVICQKYFNFNSSSILIKLIF